MKGELNTGEPHPVSYQAIGYIKSLDLKELVMIKEALASSALEKNRTAEICLETLNRLMENKPVSDRYILGLAFFIKLMQDRVGKSTVEFLKGETDEKK